MFDSTDGYALYDRLKYGEAHNLSVNDENYTFQFEGENVGHNSCLRVTTSTGETRKYYPGYDTPCVFNALDEISLGWSIPQSHFRRSYQDD